MFARLRRWGQYRLERFLVSGTFYRLVFIALAICAVVLVGGSLLWLKEGESGLDNWLSALWWCFLRMTDPGYLGDDSGLFRRTLGTVVTILGYVLFMGALIAIMTAWLHQMLRTLERGLTPLALRGHVVVLGWSERTPEILAELLATNRQRLSRFLRRSRARALRVAVLAQDAGPERESILRTRLGESFDKQAIILRDGNGAEWADLDRINCQHASVVIIATGYAVGAHHGVSDADAALARTLRTLTTLMPAGREGPRLVAPVVDHHLLPVLAGSYFADRFAGLGTRRLLARLLAHCLCQPGLAAVVRELIAQPRGCGVYLRELEEANGRSFIDVALMLNGGVAIGLRHADRTVRLAPEPDERCLAGDHLIYIGRGLEVSLAPPPPDQGFQEVRGPARMSAPAHGQRLVLLGWNRLGPQMLVEIAAVGDLSAVVCLAPETPPDLAALADQITIVTGNRCHPGDLDLVALTVGDRVLLLTPDDHESAEAADADSMLARQVLHQHLAALDLLERVPVFIELRSPSSAGLFTDPATEFLVGGDLISHALAQIGLQPILLDVYDALFGSHGASIRYCDEGVVATEGHDIRRAFLATGRVVIGLDDGAGTTLCPTNEQLAKPASARRYLVIEGGQSPCSSSH